MLDLFPPPPPLLSALSAPFARYFHLTTLPLHIHEVLLSFLLYHFVNSVGAPWVSRRLFPVIYPSFNARTKLNWDVHVVSLVQSCIINGLALYVMWTDEERQAMDWKERVWGYTGASGMIQGFATGYFLWDLCVSVVNVNVFGWGMLAHAIAALVVFSLGFRPFVNFYGPTFILYELSSPFLNFHWFFDKVQMTGSRAQLYNGIVLLATFFSCRLVWGTYQSVRVYQDVWAAIQSDPAVLANLTQAETAPGWNQTAENLKYTDEMVVPVWLACTYLGSNILLNTLNFYWFGKMIETVKKRFQPPKEKEKATVVMNGDVGGTEDGHVTSVKAERTEVRRRKG